MKWTDEGQPDFSRCVYKPWGECVGSRKICPVHSQIDKRPTKRRHKLAPGPAFRFGARRDDLLMTVCGTYVHTKIEQTELDKLGHEAAWARMSDPHFRHAPEPSRDPRVSVYYEAGWDRREILVAVGRAEVTCRKCRR